MTSMSTLSEAMLEQENLSEAKDKALTELGIFLANEIGGRPGPEWFTFRELLEQAQVTNPGVTDPKLRTLLAQLVAEGKWQRYQVSVKEIYFAKVE